MPGGCPREDGKTCKRARCEHGDICARHCEVCSAGLERRTAGRPKKDSNRRQAQQSAVSYVEVEEHEGLIEEEEQENETPAHPNSAPRCRKRNELVEVLSYLGVSDGAIKKLPGVKIRESVDAKERIKDTASGWSRFVNVTSVAIDGLVKKLLPHASDALFDSLHTKWRAGLTNKDESFREQCVLWHKKASRGSLEKRILRAQLVSCYSSKELNELGIGLAGTSISKALSDAARLEAGECLSCTAPKSRIRFDQDVACKSLEWLLSADNVCALSWSTKQVKLSASETVLLPKLTRKKSIEEMIEDYYKVFDADNQRAAQGEGKSASGNKEWLSQTSLWRVLSAVTSGYSTRSNSIVHDLLQDTFVTVNRIIDECTAHKDHKTLRNQALLACNLLTVQYPTHIDLSPTCAHHVKYALGDPSTERANLAMDCEECNSVPLFFNELRTAIQGHSIAQREDKSLMPVDKALEIVESCERKALRWQALCVQAENQRARIREVLGCMKARCMLKMWDKPAELYIVSGKRDNRWHGWMVICFVYDAEKKEARQVTTFADQIVVGSPKQDGLTHGALLESFFAQLRQEPFYSNAKDIYFQCDDVVSYRSGFFLFALLAATAANSFHLLSYLHASPCDSARELDSHFATEERLVGSSSGTEHELYEALASRTQLPNTFLQLIQIDRSHAKKMEKKYAAAVRSFDEVVEHCYEIEFEQLVSLDQKVLLKGWRFSGVHPVRSVQVNLSQGVEEKISKSDVSKDLLASEMPFRRLFGAVLLKVTSLGTLSHERERLLRAVGVVCARSESMQLEAEGLPACDTETVDLSEEQDLLDSATVEEREDATSNARVARKEHGNRAAARKRAAKASKHEVTQTRQDLLAFSVRKAEEILRATFQEYSHVEDTSAGMVANHLPPDNATKALSWGWAASFNYVDLLKYDDKIASSASQPDPEMKKLPLSGGKRHQEESETSEQQTKRQRTSNSNQPQELEDFIAQNPGLPPAKMLEQALRIDNLRQYLTCADDQEKEKDIQKKFKQRVGNVRSKMKASPVLTSIQGSLNRYFSTKR